MSGFENYPRELAELDHEIRHYAAICGIDPANPAAIRACIETQDEHHSSAATAHETLRGLLILRLKVETEMLEQGITPDDFKS